MLDASSRPTRSCTSVILARHAVLGIGEVLYDNAAQTFMPSIVHADDLEKANGRMWSAETGRQHVRRPAARRGPHRGGVRLAVLRRRRDVRRVGGADRVDPTLDHADLGRRDVERAVVARRAGRRLPLAVASRSAATLAIVLGILNLLDMMATSSFVLFGQEVLDTSARRRSPSSAPAAPSAASSADGPHRTSRGASAPARRCGSCCHRRDATSIVIGLS